VAFRTEVLKSVGDIMEVIDVRSDKRVEFIDVTSEVQVRLDEMSARDGLCHLYVPHTTAGVTINENADPSVVVDLLSMLDKLVPLSAGYSHAEGNSAAHIKSMLVGCHQAVPVEGGRLCLGTWQGIFFCEFDGPRSRKLYIEMTPRGA
jgi:secondary thiamine-phosphate synthase enzyme